MNCELYYLREKKKKKQFKKCHKINKNRTHNGRRHAAESKQFTHKKMRKTRTQKKKKNAGINPNNRAQEQHKA